ncbi:hypothetical protein HYW46_05290 [Candidatus Daviesbacteria bacterium]|nr:hypothetical protein [Candidatus Daviesbacteria bacterium]
MSESADFNPGPWQGHDFKAARAVYDRHAGRSYAEAVAQNKSTKDLVPPSLLTQSRRPLVVSIDLTGSMEEWPATICEKIAYFDLEVQEYLGEDTEVSFNGIGDATKGDRYPLQVRPFTKGLDLKVQLYKLINEHGGGGGGEESYQLAALYYARKVSMPNAIRPIHIFIGDEQPYPSVDPTQAKNFAYEDLRESVSTKGIFEELKQKYSVYIIRKPYPSMDSIIQGHWERLLGVDHVAPLPDPNRVVDVIFGILAKETTRIDYFYNELDGRQTPAQRAIVRESLKTVHTLPNGDFKALRSGRSVLHRPIQGEDSAPLI